MVDIVNMDNCSGCLLCSLACSFFNTPQKVFNLSKSMIRVKPGNGGRFEIGISADCTDCGICEKYCHYGVLGVS